MWCHQESNRGHKDFQSFALPTELWHLVFSFALQRYELFFYPQNFFKKKWNNFLISKKRSIFATQKRKVAQLVAHYVRDVGVGRSNRLFPTTHGLFVITSNLQAFFISIYMQLKESDTNLT